MPKGPCMARLTMMTRMMSLTRPRASLHLWLSARRRPSLEAVKIRGSGREITFEDHESGGTRRPKRRTGGSRRNLARAHTANQPASQPLLRSREAEERDTSTIAMTTRRNVELIPRYQRIRFAGLLRDGSSSSPASVLTLPSAAPPPPPPSPLAPPFLFDDAFPPS